jgi:hypothetical protein
VMGSCTPCPICKNPIKQSDLIPIYTKEQNKANTNRFKIPERPKGQRSPIQYCQNHLTTRQTKIIVIAIFLLANIFVILEALDYFIDDFLE